VAGDTNRRAAVSRQGRFRWRSRRVVLTLLGGGVASTGLRRVGVLSHAEQVRPLALIFLGAAIVLALCRLAHGLLYSKQRLPQTTHRRRRDTTRLVRAVHHEGTLAGYFLVAWAVEHFWPGESVEFLFAATGYIAFLIVSGRIHRLAAGLGLPSISAAILGSEGVDEIKKDLRAFTREERPESAPPLVNETNRLLDLVPRVGKASAVMSLLATCIASVAFADAGPTLESTGSVLQTLIGDTPTPSTVQGHDPPSTPGTESHDTESAKSKAEPPPKAPTYDALCGHDQVPGRGATELVAHRLYDLWLGPQGVGGLIGGCAKPARSVRPGSGIWYAPGYVSSTLVSLGVANADGTSVLTLGKPAQFAMSQAVSGTLESVSTRVPVGYGDLETVDTQIGTYVFVRQDVHDGTQSAAYTIVPPGLVGAWLSADETEGWVWPVGGHAVRGVRSFIFVTPAGQKVGAATCNGDFSCTSTIRGVASSAAGGEYVDVGQLTSVAPEAVD
jgi:hypothetical protein